MEKGTNRFETGDLVRHNNAPSTDDTAYEVTGVKLAYAGMGKNKYFVKNILTQADFCLNEDTIRKLNTDELKLLAFKVRGILALINNQKSSQ